MIDAVAKTHHIGCRLKEESVLPTSIQFAVPRQNMTLVTLSWRVVGRGADFSIKGGGAYVNALRLFCKGKIHQNDPFADHNWYKYDHNDLFEVNLGYPKQWFQRASPTAPNPWS
jgi:hypothetical protein